MASVYTSAGEALIVDLIDGTSAAHLATAYVAWGEGTTAPAKGNTALVTESEEARKLAVDSQSAADTNQWVGTITSTGTKTIAEAGLFTNSTTGTCIIRGTFTGIPTINGDAIEFTISLQQS